MTPGTALTKALPAYDTKNEPLIKIPVKTKSGETVDVELQQSDKFSDTTGTTLWLGAQVSQPVVLDVNADVLKQVLSAYLASLSGRKLKSKQKAIDLGAGIGELAAVETLIY